MSSLLTKIKPPVLFYPNFLNSVDDFDWFQKSKELEWTRSEINIYGKSIPVPRDESLFGDDLHYEYRGTKIEAAPWPDFLLEARDRIQALSGYQFNFVVGNRYRTGKDSIGWHSDNFPQIGKRPALAEGFGAAIASLSLGSTRKFKLRHKDSGETVEYHLESGSLLIMLPGCQEDWVHTVPKTARPVGERINWTFRPHVEAIGNGEQKPERDLPRSLWGKSQVWQVIGNVMPLEGYLLTSTQSNHVKRNIYESYSNRFVRKHRQAPGNRVSTKRSYSYGYQQQAGKAKRH